MSEDNGCLNWNMNGHLAKASILFYNLPSVIFSSIDPTSFRASLSNPPFLELSDMVSGLIQGQAVFRSSRYPSMQNDSYFDFPTAACIRNLPTGESGVRN